MIRRLVDATIERSLNDRDLAWLRAMLDDGFAGYGKLTNAGLTRELQLRGLPASIHPTWDASDSS